MTEFAGRLYRQESIPKLESAAQVAPTVYMSAESLRELALSGQAPCVWFGNSKEPWFFRKDLVAWIKDSIVRIQEGSAFEPIAIPVERPTSSALPFELQWLAARLVVLTHECNWSAVYFLCRDARVVYVGQSPNPVRRIGEHRGSGKRFDSVFLLPVPEVERLKVEGAFIKLLRAEYNIRSQIPAPLSDEQHELLRSRGWSGERPPGEPAEAQVA
jgi:hypothetical protein